MKKFTKTIFLVFFTMLCAWNLNAQEYNITLIPMPVEGGTVSGGGFYEFGSLVTVSVTPESNYVFLYWANEDGLPVSCDPMYSFPVIQDRTLVAHFAPAQYNITLISMPVEGGIVSGGGYNLPYGSSITVTATPHLPYFEFGYWTDAEGSIVAEDAEYTFTVTGDRYLIAHFNMTTTPFEVTVSANPEEGGTVSGGGSYTLNTPVTVTAEPNPDFLFVKWTENGNVISTDPEYSFSMLGPRNLVAHFAPQFCEIKLSKNIEEGGMPLGAGIYPYGQQVFVQTSTNSPEYQFVNWTEDGNLITWAPGFWITVTQSHHFTANFRPGIYELALYANPYEGGTGTGGGVYHYGEQVTISAHANEGYRFLNWTKYTLGEPIVVSTEPDYVVDMLGDVLGNCAFVAYFEAEAKVTIETNMEGGEILGAGAYHIGDEVTVRAIPYSDYTFVNWTTKGKDILSAENPYTFTVAEDVTLVANFKAGALSIDPIDAGAMMIYPNPTNSDLKVILNDPALKIVEMELYDLTGKKVHQQIVNQSYGTLQMNSLAEGTYILKLFLDQGEPVVCRVVKN